MGPEYHRLHQADDQELQFDQKVRDQLLRGCRVVRDVEEKLQRIPAGKLGEGESFELRSNLAISSMEIVATFNETAKLLVSMSNSSPATSPSVRLDTCIAALPRKRPFSAVGKSSLEVRGTPMECGNNAESPLSTARNGETPPLSPAGAAAATAKRFTPSPPRSSNSEMSDGSRARIPTLERETDARAGRREFAETAENDGVCISRDARDNPRKRRSMPKITLRLPASNLDQGVETPPDDGHTWRKYGQKTILGARFPRSYYRCTHKPDLGCQATKQVQRYEDNSPIFDVTYRGNHTCRSEQLDNQTWPFAFPHPLSQANAHYSFSFGSPSALSTVQQPSAVAPFLSSFCSIPMPNTPSITLSPSGGTLESLVVTSKFGTRLGQVEPDNYQRLHAGLRDGGGYDYSESKDSPNPRTATGLSSLQLMQGAMSPVINRGSFKVEEIQKSSSEDESRRLDADTSFELQPETIKTNVLGQDREDCASSGREEGLQQGLPFPSPQDWSLREPTMPMPLFMCLTPSDIVCTAQLVSTSAVRSCEVSHAMHRTAECSKAGSEEDPAASLFDDHIDDLLPIFD